MAFDHQKYRPFAPINKKDRRWPDAVITKAPLWCAVDLRDGNQALIKPMTVEQKQRLFELLVKLGFKEIEVGFPAASQPDFDFVRQLIEQQRIPADVHIQVLTQARPELIARTFAALEGAERAVVHLYNSTSTVQRERVFGLDRAGIIDIAVKGAEQIKAEAAKRPQTAWSFEYSPESFTGTELSFAKEIVDAVTAVWRPDLGQRVIINLPSTVEMATPNVFADQVEWMVDNLNQRQHLIISVHTHNDRGCGVAAAELAVMAGADRVEGTLLGNGERTGNMDLVTMAMNLYSQGIDPALNLSAMAEIVETVEQCTAIQTHPRHPYAGELVFTAFSGSHQDAIRKCLAQQQADEPWQVAYLPIDPSDLGRHYDAVVRINSQSGKGGVAYVLERDFGISLPRWLQVDFSQKVQGEAEAQGGELDPATIHRLFEQHYLQVAPSWQLHTYDLHRSDAGVEARLSFGDHPTRLVRGQGQGAVEALVNALAQHFGVAISVNHYDEFALGEGTSAQAMAGLQLLVAGQPAVGVAIGSDTTGAVVQALLMAVGHSLQTTTAANG